MKMGKASGEASWIGTGSGGSEPADERCVEENFVILTRKLIASVLDKVGDMLVECTNLCTIIQLDSVKTVHALMRMVEFSV